MEPGGAANSFVQHYYYTLHTNPRALVALYQEGSMLTFEGEKCVGPSAFVDKLSVLLEKCVQYVNAVDCQPVGPMGGILIFVSGFLQGGDGRHHIKFGQIFHLMPMFHLKPVGPGNFYVQNDVFRLNYA